MAIKNIFSILDSAVLEHNPVRVFALMSGGHDSLCMTHLTSQHPRFSGVVHINTTIGIEETREFVQDTCKRHGWPLKEFFPPVSYEQIVIKYGFPGPGGHLYMYTRLKQRCIERLVRESKVHIKDRVALVTGVRLQESTRRMGHVRPIIRHGAQVWVAPILHWSSADKDAYIAANKLTRNPVVEQLCMSGECLCGAFAHPNELKEIEVLFPKAAAKIRHLEFLCAAAAVHAKWGTRPAGKRKQKQTPSGGLCYSCEAKRTVMPWE